MLMSCTCSFKQTPNDPRKGKSKKKENERIRSFFFCSSQIDKRKFFSREEEHSLEQFKQHRMFVLFLFYFSYVFILCFRFIMVGFCLGVFMENEINRLIDLDSIYSVIQSARKTSSTKMVFISNGKIQEENYTRINRSSSSTKTENVKFSRMERSENSL